MIHLKYALFYSLLCVCLFSCAQSKNITTNIYGTYTVHLPGNIPVDEKGNSLARRDTVITIYVDSKEEVKWIKAWRNEKEYSILTESLSSPAEAGIQIDHEKLIIHASRGNKLWQLRLMPEETKSLPPIIPDQNQILLLGEYNGKKITQIISTQMELLAIPSV